jgi:alpha-1,2-mannosyltransferase
MHATPAARRGAGRVPATVRGAVDWLTRPAGRRWLLRALLAYAVVGFGVWIQRPGDFAGYLIVGNLARTGGHIYLDAQFGLNTWPPFFSLLCIPLAVLAAPTPYLARAVWLLLNFGCVLLVLHMVAQLLYGRALRLRAETSGLSLAAPEMLVPLLLSDRYVSGNFDHLQVNLVIFTLALGGLYLQARGRVLLGSVALGSAVALKVMPLIFIPYLCYRRRWRAAALTSAAAGAFSLSPMMVYGWERFWNYVTTWRSVAASWWSVGKMNQSVLAMWDRFIGHGLLPFAPHSGIDFNAIAKSGDPWVSVALLATLLVVGAAAWWSFRHVTQDPWAEPVEWGIVFVIGALFSPVCWKAYLCVLLLPNATLFAAWRSPRFTHGRRIIGGTLFLPFVLGGLTSRGFVGKTLSDLFEMASVPTLCTLVTMAGLLWLRAQLPAPQRT